MIFNGLNMMKHGIKNYVFTTKAIDFSLLKSRASVDFNRLKSGDLIEFQGLPAPLHTVAHVGHVYSLASWKLEAASWLKAGKAERTCIKFNKNVT